MNSDIIENLEVLLAEAKHAKELKDRFRAKAYANAIAILKKHPTRVKSGAEAKSLGIGDKIAAKIQEILDTGELHQVEALGEETLARHKAAKIFTEVWGIGPAKADELWDAGARTIADLQQYKDLLTDNQKVGLKYFEDLKKRAPRADLQVIADAVSKEIAEITAERGWRIRHRVCGSFRRQLETCGDMDILLCEKDNQPILETLVQRLEASGVLKERLGLGKTKYMGITILPAGQAFRIDMEVVQPHEYPFALLYFTGSGGFNEKQRLIAKKMGYSLSEHGLEDLAAEKESKKGSKIFVQGLQNELDIFEFLGMKYLPPWDRQV